MTANILGLAFLAAVLMLAPLAAADAHSAPTAEPDDSARPDDAAWVDDCPPDMLCAASSNQTTAEGNHSRDEDCEYCRDHQGEDCVDCMPSPGTPQAYGACDESLDCIFYSAPHTGPQNDGGADVAEVAESPLAGMAVLLGVSVLGLIALGRVRRTT